MLRFIIMGGLPYLYVEGKAYKCRFDEKGFTPTQDEVEITEEPAEVFRELEIKAQCACLDSIGGAEKPAKKTAAKKTAKKTAAKKTAAKK